MLGLMRAARNIKLDPEDIKGKTKLQILWMSIELTLIIVGAMTAPFIFGLGVVYIVGWILSLFGINLD